MNAVGTTAILLKEGTEVICTERPELIAAMAQLFWSATATENDDVAIMVLGFVNPLQDIVKDDPSAE